MPCPILFGPLPKTIIFFLFDGIDSLEVSVLVIYVRLRKNMFITFSRKTILAYKTCQAYLFVKIRLPEKLVRSTPVLCLRV